MKCVICSTKVTTKQYALPCKTCKSMTHMLCGIKLGMDKAKYQQYKREETTIIFTAKIALNNKAGSTQEMSMFTCQDLRMH